METLVLDTSYVPVARVHWQRAVTLLFMGKVEVVEEYEDKDIKSVTFSIKMPSIVRFLRSMTRKRRTIKFSRENVFARDNGKCQYCGVRLARPEATYDHVVPRAQGGLTTWENVVICCVPCNQRKGNRTPAQARMTLKTTPTRPRKLPDHVRITVAWRKGDPDSWLQWLSSYSYWNAELEA